MRAIKYLIFFLLVYSSAAQNQIVKYEFWLDNDYSGRTTQQITPAEEIILQKDIDISGTSRGFHLFNIRFADSDGNWSSAVRKMIYKTGSGNADENQIVSYEFWADGDFAGRQSGSVSPSGEIVLDDFLDISSLDRGLHRFHIRFFDAAGNPGVVQSAMIFKMGNSDNEENLIVKYRYWFDDNFDNAEYIELPEPQTESSISLMLPIPGEDTQSFSIQFLDAGGMWSSPYTRLFIPEAAFDIYNTISTFTFMNNTSFGVDYKWDFGDGSEISTETNPTHDYNEPGIYDVCLVAENQLGTDTLCKIISVAGLREVVSSSAGNIGWATVMIYGGALEDGSKVWLEKDGEKYLEAEDVYLARLDALSARFDLYDKEIGIYDVALEWPDGEISKLDGAFEITPGTLPEPYVSFNGRSNILFGRWQTYTIDFGNTGNTDALGVPLYFMVTVPPGMEIEFQNLNIEISQYWKDNEHYDEISAMPEYITRQGYFGGNEEIRLYAFYIPVIAANSSGQVRLRIVTNDDFKAYVWLNEPMFELDPEGKIVKKDTPLSKAIDKKTAACLRAVMATAMKDGIADFVDNVVPGVGCANSLLNHAFQPADYLAPEPTNPEYDRPKSWSDTFWSWGNTIKDYSLTIASCASVVIPVSHAFNTAMGVISLANNIYGGLKAGNECYKKYKNGQLDVNAVSSFDPNEIVGPPGFAEPNYINQDAFSYTIFFENKPDATAPAQEVIIIDTLDTDKYDFRSFEFGMFSFGNNSYSPLPGAKQFTLDIDQPGNDANIVRVNADFDTATGIARWQFITLDKSSMALTEDPMGGFLPPNQTSPEGEGSVSYKINIKELPNDSEINASAKIVFDLNEPIFTNIYKNTIDRQAPESQIKAIYYTKTENYYRLEIEGSDAQSGIDQYIIYISEDDGEFLPRYSAHGSEFFFNAEPGVVYKFYSVAVDSVGNTEQPPADYDVSTMNVAVHKAAYPQAPAIRAAPNPARTSITIEYDLPADANITVDIRSNLGARMAAIANGELKSAGTHTLDLNIGSWPQGVYFVRMIHKGRTYSEIITICK